jgi:hypothetical protein
MHPLWRSAIFVATAIAQQSHIGLKILASVNFPLDILDWECYDKNVKTDGNGSPMGKYTGSIAKAHLWLCILSFMNNAT